MGNVYNLHCTECGYKEELYLGSGLASIRLSFLAESLNEKDRLELKRLEEYGIKHIIGSNQLIKRCECNECRDDNPLYEGTIVNVTDKDCNTHVLGGECENCGKLLEILEISNPLLCPRCGNIIKLDVVGHWD